MSKGSIIITLPEIEFDVKKKELKNRFNIRLNIKARDSLQSTTN